MKRFLSLVVGLFCLCVAAQAQVPSLINYQGRLTDKAGTPVNGAVDVVLRVYDAKTEGKKVYEETIPQVSVVNGVYSFGYGGAGKSTKRSAEVVAVADGETKVFNYSTAHKPLLMDVQLSDGTYTWGSQGGPSDAAQFIGSINAELGNVTAIYIQNAPAKDTIINAVYHYHEERIVGALSQNKECWQELTINGKTLSPRERLVSVPFALVAAYSKSIFTEKRNFRIPYVTVVNNRSVPSTTFLSQASFPYEVSFNSNVGANAFSRRLDHQTGFHVPPYINKLINIAAEVNYLSSTMKSRLGVKFLVKNKKNNLIDVSQFTLEEGVTSEEFNLQLDHMNYDYFIKLIQIINQSREPSATIQYLEFNYR